jgi:hypothetical protein
MPFDFQEAIQAVREIAEGRVSVPDLGITRISDTTQRRTATEVNAVSTMFQQSSDLRMRIFRMGLGKLYRKAWTLLLENNRKSRTYFYVDERATVDEQALHPEYMILPNGSADGVNKSYLFQKAIARYQMFGGHPNINQAELAKSVLEVDDPAIVRRLFVESGLEANDDREEQAMEIAIMAKGLPAYVSPDDNDEEHLRVLAAYIAQSQQAETPPGPGELQMLQQHMAEHMQQLQQKDPKTAKAAQDAFSVLFEAGQTQAEPAAQ